MADVANIGFKVDTSGLEKAQREFGRVRRAGDDAADSINKKFGGARGVTDKLTQGFERAQKAVFSLRGAVVALGAVAALNKLRQSFTGFETSLQQIVGLVGVAQAEVDKFGEAILGLAPAVGKGPDELAKAMFFITSAGQRGQAAIDVLTQSARAASAGLGETKSVADAVTSAINAFSTSGLTAAQATDTLVSTVREGKLEASQLAGAIGQVLAVAQGAGLRFDEVGASLASLTQIGIKTSSAVAGLRGLLAALSRESTEGEKVLKGVGTSFAELRESIREKGLIETLANLRNALGDNETALVKIFSDIEAVNAVMALTGSNVENVRAIFGRMSNAAGATDKAFAAVADTVEFRTNVALARLSVAGTKMGGVVFPALASAVEFASEHLKELAALVAGFIALKLTGTVLAVLSAFNGLGDAIRSAAAAGGALNIVLSANPIFKIAAVVTAVGAAYIGLAKSSGAAETASSKLADQLDKEIGKLDAVKKSTRELAKERLADAKAQLAQVQAQASEKTHQLVQLQNQIQTPNLNTSKLFIQRQNVETRGAINSVKAELESLNQQANILSASTKAAEDALERTKKATDKVTKSTKGASDATDDLTDKQKETIKESAIEVEQLKRLRDASLKSEDARQKVMDAIARENELRKSGLKVGSAEFKQLEDNIRQRQKLEREIDKAVDKREEDQKKREEQIKKEQEMMQEPFKNALRGIQDSFTDTFESIFSGGVNSFKDLADSVKRIMIRMAAEIATLMVFRPVVGGALSSVGLGGVAQQMGLGGGGIIFNPAGTPGGGIGGAGPDIGSLGSVGSGLINGFSTPGIGRFIADAALEAGLGTTAAGRGFFFGGGANLGFGALGGLGANLLGLGSGNALIDTGLGTAGAFIGGGLGGPVGAAIGGFLGTAAGSFFGGGGQVNSPLTEGFTGVGPDGRLRVTGVGAKGADVGEGRKLAQGGVDFINALLQSGALSSVSAAPRFDTKFGQIRTFVGPTPNYRDVPSGGFLGQGGDAQQVFIDTVQNMVSRGFAQVDSPEVRTAIQNSAAKTVEQFASDLDFAAALSSIDLNPEELTQAEQALRQINEQFNQMADRARALGLSISSLENARERAISDLSEGFVTSVEDAILQFTDPQALQRRELTRRQEARMREAEALGVDTTLLERLNRLEMQRLGGTSGIEQAIQAVSFGELSGASPRASLTGTRSAFQSAAAGGNVQEVLRLGQTLVTRSRQFNASGAGFEQDRSLVEGVFRSLLPGGGDTSSLVNAVNLSGSENVRLLMELRGQLEALNGTLTQVKNDNAELKEEIERLARAS